MSCGCGGAFFRQLNTVTEAVTDTDVHVISLTAPQVAWSWWQVGKRLVFEVPAKGVLYSDTTFGIRFRDNTALANYTVRSFVIPAGTEIESFRLVCDVIEIANSDVSLNVWLDFPFSIGLGADPLSSVTFNTNFHPLEVQLFVQQAEEVESEIVFQDIQYSGLPKTALLIC